MKAVILAGGLGTRIQEESNARPKPMVEIGGRPILWHIMKIFYHHGINEFIICCGYKGYQIKEYFANYTLHMSDVSFDFSKKKTVIHKERGEKWKVTLCDTGENSMTGERLRRVGHFLDESEPFFFTYGDGLADIDLKKLLNFHIKEKRLATLTAVTPQARYGALILNENSVVKFQEKPPLNEDFINGGFFVMQKQVLNFITKNNEPWEASPLENLALSNQLSAFKHNGFWHSMDTLRDRNYLNDLWTQNDAPWKIWGDD